MYYTREGNTAWAEFTVVLSSWFSSPSPGRWLLAWSASELASWVTLTFWKQSFLVTQFCFSITCSCYLLPFLCQGSTILCWSVTTGSFFSSTPLFFHFFPFHTPSQLLTLSFFLPASNLLWPLLGSFIYSFIKHLWNIQAAMGRHPKICAITKE